MSRQLIQHGTFRITRLFLIAQISIPETRIIAHCMFDGWTHSNPKKWRYYIGYSNCNRVLINQFKKDMEKVYGLCKGNQRVNGKGVPMIEYGSKEVFKVIKPFIKNKTRIHPWIIIASKEIKIAFLRAFFDDEGRIVFAPEKYTRRIVGTSINPVIRKQLITLLGDIGIKSRENGVDVTIMGRENISKFSNKIGFTAGVKVVRKRKFSRWFGMEKNTLVKGMLTSYQKKSTT